MVSAPSPASKRRGSGGDRANMAIHRRANGGSGVGGGGLPTSSASPRGKEKEVGQFLLGKTMGEGTFGEVKLAMHKPTSERVAAKVWRLACSAAVFCCIAVRGVYHALKTENSVRVHHQHIRYESSRNYHIGTRRAV